MTQFLEKLNDVIQLVKLVTSKEAKKIVKWQLILALLPWIPVMHLYHGVSAANLRIVALEKQVKDSEDAQLLAVGAVQYAAKVERNLDDFQAWQSNQNDDLWRAFSLLQKMCKKRK